MVARLLQPGWYWYHYLSAEQSQIDAFRRSNPGLIPRVMFRGATTGAEIMVFELVGGAIAWTLPGYPTKAPKKAKTTPFDIATAPDPPPSLVSQLEELIGKPFAEVKKLASSTTTVVHVVLFAGAGILLWNLFRNTAPSGEA